MLRKEGTLCDVNIGEVSFSATGPSRAAVEPKLLEEVQKHMAAQNFTEFAIEPQFETKEAPADSVRVTVRFTPLR